MVTGVNVVLIGPMASGKTTLAKALSGLGMTHIRSYTTRPRRVNESESQEYEFCTDSEFEIIKKLYGMVAVRSYLTASGETWKYGISPNDFDQIELTQFGYVVKDTVSILDPDGYLEIRERIPNTFGVLLDIPEWIRRDRTSARGDDADEVNRRFLADEESFAWINEHVEDVCSMRIRKIRDPYTEASRILSIVKKFREDSWKENHPNKEPSWIKRN